MPPNNPETKLTRDAAAVALTAAGYPTTGALLAKLATKGGGPEYQIFGRSALYERGPLFTWAKARMRSPENRKKRLIEPGAAAQAA